MIIRIPHVLIYLSISILSIPSRVQLNPKLLRGIRVISHHSILFTVMYVTHPLTMYLISGLAITTITSCLLGQSCHNTLSCSHDKSQQIGVGIESILSCIWTCMSWLRGWPVEETMQGVLVCVSASLQWAFRHSVNESSYEVGLEHWIDLVRFLLGDLNDS